MSLDKVAWRDDMIMRAFAGAFAGVVVAALVPAPHFALAALGGCLSGIAFGLVALPIKALLVRLRERRRLTKKE
jgi:Zn-dependent protease with chaperone function